MSALSGHVADYLRLRRALGFKLEREGQLLDQFLDYLGAAGSVRVTSELAIAWARQPAGAQPNHWAKRLGVVRKFAAYLQTIEPATEVPPPGVFPARRRRPTPYLWSQSDICRLREGPASCARHCAPPPTRRSSGCSHPRACGWARRSRCSAKTSTWTRVSLLSARRSSTVRGWCRCIPAPPRRCAATPPNAPASARGRAQGPPQLSCIGTFSVVPPPHCQPGSVVIVNGSCSPWRVLGPQMVPMPDRWL